MARILIVDDEADLVEACTLVLEGEGHAVRSVTDARRALEQAREEHPDLVLLDWLMPGCDGGVVLSQLRADRDMAGARVLVTSALPDIAATAQAAGADGFLAKPFDADQLNARLTALLGGGQLQNPIEIPRL